MRSQSAADNAGLPRWLTEVTDSRHPPLSQVAAASLHGPRQPLPARPLAVCLQHPLSGCGRGDHTGLQQVVGQCEGAARQSPAAVQAGISGQVAAVGHVGGVRAGSARVAGERVLVVGIPAAAAVVGVGEPRAESAPSLTLCAIAEAGDWEQQRCWPVRSQPREWSHGRCCKRRGREGAAGGRGGGCARGARPRRRAVKGRRRLEVLRFHR